MSLDLMPSNSTAFERAFSLAVDAADRLSPGIGAVKTAKLVSLPEAFLPFLIYEYGLGEVSAYVADQRRLLSIGIDWQRVRGTPEAMALALDWLGYSARIEEAPARRARWNLFQLELGRIRDNETPDLENIEGVAALSVPVRSHFWRGFKGYDVREAEWSWHRWSKAMWSSSSGISLRDGGAKWSFGRNHDFQIVADQSNLEPLDAWLTEAGTSLGWGAFSWDGADGVTWISADAQARTNAILAILANRQIYFAFRNAQGNVIGYRRARCSRSANPQSGGIYRVDNIPLQPADTNAAGLYVEAMTDFGDGNGAHAASVSMVWDAAPTNGAAPGTLWLGPGGLTGGVEVMSAPADILFGRTVRERVRFFITF